MEQRAERASRRRSGDGRGGGGSGRLCVSVMVTSLVEVKETVGTERRWALSQVYRD